MGGGHEAKKQPATTEGDEKLTWEEGRTGHGPLTGDLRGMHEQPLSFVEDYPPNISPLEKKRWYNYLLDQPLPPIISKNAQENQRIWQEIEVERMLDHQPAHEIHPSELPDYHYWPMIMNEIHHKPKTISAGTEFHHQDQTDIPRFFRTGIPKTPLQQQDWYIPLTKDGRFDWKKNLMKNGYLGGSLFSKQGWNQRYLLAIDTPQLPYHHPGHKLLTQGPTYFRKQEVPIYKRLGRFISGSRYDLVTFITVCYCSLLVMGASASAHWSVLNWVNEPYNYDMAFQQRATKMGGFHGMV